MTGNVRYGYRDVGDGLVKPDRHEQAVIREMIRLREQDTVLRDISKKLARRGWVQRNGKPFASKTIMTILARATS